MRKYIIPIKKLVLFRDTGSRFCRLPYPGHPKGCPNWYKKKVCPPHAPMAAIYFDITKPLYFVHSEFDLSAHIVRMKLRNPDWSERQCKCVLYWQGTSRKQMRERVKIAIFELGTNAQTACPEGMGVNVYATARLSGLKMDRIKGMKVCRHITLIGSRRHFQNPSFNENMDRYEGLGLEK